MKYLIFLSVTVLIVFSSSYAQFLEDFESYIVGQQIACQNPTEWTTWSNFPCDPTEDPYISSNHSYSGTKSLLIINNNDAVRLLGNQTYGYWIITSRVYIPAGKSGYFSVLSGFTPDSIELPV